MNQNWWKLWPFWHRVHSIAFFEIRKKSSTMKIPNFRTHFDQFDWKWLSRFVQITHREMTSFPNQIWAMWLKMKQKCWKIRHFHTRANRLHVSRFGKSRPLWKPSHSVSNSEPFGCCWCQRKSGHRPGNNSNSSQDPIRHAKRHWIWTNHYRKKATMSTAATWSIYWTKQNDNQMKSPVVSVSVSDFYLFCLCLCLSLSSWSQQKAEAAMNGTFPLFTSPSVHNRIVSFWSHSSVTLLSQALVYYLSSNFW